MKKFLVMLFCWLFTLPAFAKNSILIVGDSISAAYGIDINQGWVSLLKKRLTTEKYDAVVINASISGDTTSNGLARLPALLAKNHPNITIIELGGNDGLRGIPLSVIKANLSHMITASLGANSKVLLLGVRLPPNYGPDYTKQFQEIYTTLANEYHISIVPNFLKNVDENIKLMQNDGVHPTQSAQAILFENVWPEIQKLL